MVNEQSGRKEIINAHKRKFISFNNYDWIICGNNLFGCLGFKNPSSCFSRASIYSFGNTLTAVAILYLGYRNGMLAGIIGLGGFDLLNGYAATSWLTMLEVVVVASVLTAVYKGMHYQDSKKNIIILGIIAGFTKIFTTYCVSIVEALMVGTSLNVALVSSFVSLPATIINSISTAICTPILYFAVRDGARRILRRTA